MRLARRSLGLPAGSTAECLVTAILSLICPHCSSDGQPASNDREKPGNQCLPSFEPSAYTVHTGNRDPNMVPTRTEVTLLAIPSQVSAFIFVPHSLHRRRCAQKSFLYFASSCSSATVKPGRALMNAVNGGTSLAMWPGQIGTWHGRIENVFRLDASPSQFRDSRLYALC